MSPSKKALITGITGQDGSYLAELLLSKQYSVHGIKRRSSNNNCDKINHLFHGSSKYKDSIKIHDGDLTDSNNITQIINQVQPDEIYNLGAQSFVGSSFETPEYTANCNGLGTLRILEAIRILGLKEKTKFYQAGTSELFGLIKESPQKESTPFHPRSPYGVSKLFAHWITINYREAYGIFACNGILFNHESPRRGEEFVTKKIIKGLVLIDKGFSNCLSLGNLDALRDWGHARDYVEMQWRMLQQKEPQDFVIATGRQTSIRDFIQLASLKLGWGKIIWKGKGINEIGLRKDTGEKVININPKYFRPSEVSSLLGDPSLAKEKLSWEPRTNLEELIEEMISNEMKEANKLKDSKCHNN